MSTTTVNALVIIGGIGLIALIVLIMVLVAVQPSSGSWTSTQRAEQTRTCLINESSPAPDSRVHRSPDQICTCWVAYVEARVPYAEVDSSHPSTNYRTVSKAAFDTCDP